MFVKWWGVSVQENFHYSTWKFFMKTKLLLICAGVFLAGGMALAQEKDTEKYRIHLEALTQDAEYISRTNGKKYEETLRQLVLEDDIREQGILLKLKEEFKERLTGISINNEKNGHIVVLLKGEEQVDNRLFDIDGTPLVVEFRTGHQYSYDELAEARNKVNWAEVRKVVPRLMGSGTDQSKGEIVLLAQENHEDDVEYMQERVKEIFGVPVRVDFIQGTLKRGPGSGATFP